MKRVRAFLLAALLSSPLCAEDVSRGVIGPFGGLNNSDSAIIIPANAAQDLLNVDITPGGKSVKKRKGYAQSFATAITTSAVHGTYAFYDSSGNDVVLAFNDTRLAASVAGASPSTIMSSATAAQTWQCIDSQGFAYCAGSSRQWIVKTEGTTWSQHTVVSTGTMLAVTPKRMVQAGFSATPSRLDFSKENDFTTWTVGSQPTDPITFTITAPGSRITHIVYAHKKIYWFKESSFGYILEGAELADWQIKIVSSEIGTLDNTSTQDTDGNLYFRGQDGHIYVTDGGSVEKLSKDIETTVESAGTRRSNSVTLTSAADFIAGTIAGATSSTAYVDTTTVVGKLQTTFPDTFDSLRNGNSSTKNVWTPAAIGHSGLSSTGTTTVSSGKLVITHSTGSTSRLYVGLRSVDPLPTITTGTTVHFRLESIPYGTFAYGGGDFRIDFSSFVLTSNGVNENKTVYIEWDTTSGSTNAFVSSVSGDVPSTSINANFPFDFDFWFSTARWSVSVNDSYVTGAAWTANPLSMATNLSKVNYVYVLFGGDPISSSDAMTGDNFSVAPQTFTYTSAAQTVSSAITAWDAFNATKDESAGSLAFAIRSTNTAVYTSISAGAIPTVSTHTYWQVHSTFTLTTSNVMNPVSVSDITQNWFEGSAADKSYATFHDDKIMFSVAAGAGQSTNNRILVYDLITPGWTLYDLPVNGFYRRNRALYFGSSSAGYVHKFGEADSDNGTAIEAYWKSKEYFLDDPSVDKEITSLSFFTKGETSSDLDVTYTLNGETETSFSFVLDETASYVRKNRNLPLGKIGGTLSVEFGNDASDSPFEVFSVGYAYRVRPWRPE